MDEIAKLLLDSPDRELDASVRPLISGWSEPPTALEVLEVLDLCVRGSLASGFIVRVLEVLLDLSFKREKTDLESVAARAPWRECRHGTRRSQCQDPECAVEEVMAS